MLAVRLKELELELSRQQYQSQLLQIRALELETRRDVRLKELELQLKTGQPPSPSLEAKGNIIPAPHTRATETNGILQKIIQKCANRHFSLQTSSSPHDLLQTLENIVKMMDDTWIVLKKV
ncbi:GTPase IMAP family member 7-like isoform X1 [Labeo rohita]|uniref:GTPase IMAP family member 7-like isoform X1 n=1 Tax=Labeo rohita TaxID=84645 RepID=A0A498NNH0_LABRO|nr:GTPase IMAP family member 7-like isoform X1 [Labeo rohita]